MSTILRIDTSSRVAGSHSRALGDHFETSWLANHPGDRVIRRDLAADPIPHIADETIAGFFTPPDALTRGLKAATALSDLLIAEVKSADFLLLTVPMYNFSVPSALKAWIDQISRIGLTFSYDGANFAGLLTGKRAFVINAYGAAGYQQGHPFAGMNFLRPYLQGMLGFLGMEVSFVGVEGTTGAPDTVASHVVAARSSIDALIAAE